MEEATVNIFGTEIKLKHNLSAERLKKIVGRVNGMMRDTHKKFKDFPVNKIAMLVSLELANQLEEFNDELKQKLNRELGRLINKIDVEL